MSSSNRKIVRSEFLHYNPAINSDKVYNLFLIQNGEADDCDCISEHGRRGSSLVRVIVSSNRPRSAAEGDFKRKLDAKRNHRNTPYERNPAGLRDSRLAAEFENETVSPNHPREATRAAKSRMSPVSPKPRGVLNREQFDSLEF